MKMYFATINNEPVFAPVVAVNDKMAKDQLKPLKKAVIKALEDNISKFTLEIKKGEDGFNEYLERQSKAIALFGNLKGKELCAELIKLEIIPNDEFFKQATKKAVQESIDKSQKSFDEFKRLSDIKIKEVKDEIVKYNGTIEFFVLER